MVKYELTYFNSRGRAEVSRWIFAVAGQKFEDTRLTREQWVAIKESTPFGQLPMLTVDDNFKLSQSNAIARFLGKRFGLMGKTDVDEAKVNMVMDCVEDLTNAMMKMMFGDDASKAAARQKWEGGQCVEELTKFEKLLGANKVAGGFFVGDKVTVADMAFVIAMSYLEGGGFKDWDKFPRVKAVRKLVQEDNKAIKDWIKNRPVTEM